MVSHRAINVIMQTSKKEVHFFFFSVCCIVFNCSWQLIMLDKKQKSCVKRIHLVTDDGLYDWKAFYTVKIVYLFILYEWWRIYQLLISYRTMSPIFISSWKVLHENYITRQQVLHLSKRHYLLMRYQNLQWLKDNSSMKRIV